MKLKFRTDVGISVIACFSIVISLLNGTWLNYPSGCDTYGHLTKVRYILEFWPHCNWGYIWACGMPLFRWYSLVPYYLVALFSKITMASIEFSQTFAFLISIIITGVMIYLSVNNLSENDHLASLTAAFLTVSSACFWNYGIGGGMYPRIIAMAVFSLYLYFLLSYLKQKFNGTPKLVTYLAVLISFSLCILSHPWAWVVAVLTCLISPLFCVKTWKGKLVTILKLLLPSMLISAFFVVPFFSYIPGILSDLIVRLSVVNRTLEGQVFTRFDIIRILTGWNSPSGGLSHLSPLIAPLTLTLTTLTLAKLRYFGTMQNNVFRITVVKAFGIISIALIIFPLMKPTDVSYLLFLIAFLPIICGILLHQVGSLILLHPIKLNVYRSQGLKVIKVLLLLGIAVTTLMYEYPPTSYSFRVSESSVGWREVDQLLINETGAKIANYRFGAPDPSISVWFNYRYPNIAQTRDYMATSVLNKDIIFWFSLMVWGGKTGDKFITGGYLETNFLLDWFAVKWFATYPPYDSKKFLEAPNSYQEIVRSEKEEIHGFIYKEATPIILPTSAPTLLVIGGGRPYDYVLRALAYTDYNSRYVIPIRGQDFIDDFSLEELRKFNVIVLYDYNYHNFDRSWELLLKYVENGGSLIIDTGSSPEVTSSYIPPPSPVSKTLKMSSGKEWHFSATSSPVTDGINFTSFSPAIYEDGPWAVSSTNNESVRSWAQPVLWDKGYPLVVIGKYGQGSVIWSGLNLIYHILTYQNFQEALFLNKMIDWASKTKSGSPNPIDYAVNRPTPEKVVVAIQRNFNGILFKEFKIDNWRSYLEGSTGEKTSLKIYEAGLNFMYVFVPRNLTIPSKIVFEYGWSTIDYIGNLTSLTTFSLLMIYGFMQKQVRGILGKHVFSVFRRLKKKIKDYWYREG